MYAFIHVDNSVRSIACPHGNTRQASYGVQCSLQQLELLMGRRPLQHWLQSSLKGKSLCGSRTARRQVDGTVALLTTSLCALANASLHSGDNPTSCLRHWHYEGRLYDAGADDIIKQAAQMRTAAQAELVLDKSSESEAVISYLSDLVQSAGRQQAEQQRIVQHQTFLHLPRMVNEDLTQAKEEVISPLPSMHGRLVWNPSPSRMHVTASEDCVFFELLCLRDWLAHKVHRSSTPECCIHCCVSCTSLIYTDNGYSHVKYACTAVPTGDMTGRCW